MDSVMSERQADGTHGGDGTYIETLETAERDAQMARRRSQGASYRTVAREFGVSVSTAHEAVERALRAARAEAGEAARQMELARLDSYIERVEQVLQSQHVTVSQGRVVRRLVGFETDENGDQVLDESGNRIGIYEDVVDDGPILQAVDRLLKLSESRRKLLGLDAAQKLETTGSISYTIHGVSDDDLG
jgi:transposase-like protein